MIDRKQVLVNHDDDRDDQYDNQTYDSKQETRNFEPKCDSNDYDEDNVVEDVPVQRAAADTQCERSDDTQQESGRVVDVHPEDRSEIDDKNAEVDQPYDVGVAVPSSDIPEESNQTANDDVDLMHADEQIQDNEDASDVQGISDASDEEVVKAVEETPVAAAVDSRDESDKIQNDVDEHGEEESCVPQVASSSATKDADLENEGEDSAVGDVVAQSQPQQQQQQQQQDMFQNNKEEDNDDVAREETKDEDIMKDDRNDDDERAVDETVEDTTADNETCADKVQEVHVADAVTPHDDGAQELELEGDGKSHNDDDDMGDGDGDGDGEKPLNAQANVDVIPDFADAKHDTKEDAQNQVKIKSK
jgi:hypothetical protein